MAINITAAMKLGTLGERERERERENKEKREREIYRGKKLIFCKENIYNCAITEPDHINELHLDYM